MIAVIDTNIIVSGFWSRSSSPHQIIAEIVNGSIQLCLDYRVLAEYEEVLKRPRFQFQEADVDAFLSFVKSRGLSIVPKPLPEIRLPDESDRPFYELARHLACPLVTGNTKHFPKEPMIMSAEAFCRNYLSKA